MANLGSGTIQWGSHLSSTTRPILAETLWEAKRSSAQKPRGEGKRKTLQLKHYERWKTFWLRKQGRKRGGRHRWPRVNSATPMNHKSPWKTQCLIHCSLQWYTQLQNEFYICFSLCWCQTHHIQRYIIIKLVSYCCNKALDYKIYVQEEAYKHSATPIL